MKAISIMVTAIVFFIAMTIITGFVYPLIVTGFAQAFLPFQANGSIVSVADTPRGSKLLAQDFSTDRFFHGRPSAASFATVPSGASNHSPVGKTLAGIVAGRENNLKSMYGNVTIPADLLYASASGLDPDISIEAALLQVDRVALARGFNGTQKAAIKDYINNNPEAREFFPSVPRINIMDLNAMLETDPQFAMVTQ